MINLTIIAAFFVGAHAAASGEDGGHFDPVFQGKEEDDTATTHGPNLVLDGAIRAQAQAKAIGANVADEYDDTDGFFSLRGSGGKDFSGDSSFHFDFFEEDLGVGRWGILHKIG